MSDPAHACMDAVDGQMQALSDDQKRAHYDTYGHDDTGGGMRGGGHPGFHGGRPMRPEDLFNMFEMGGGGFAFGMQA